MGIRVPQAVGGIVRNVQAAMAQGAGRDEGQAEPGIGRAGIGRKRASHQPGHQGRHGDRDPLHLLRGQPMGRAQLQQGIHGAVGEPPGREGLVGEQGRLPGAAQGGELPVGRMPAPFVQVEIPIAAGEHVPGAVQTPPGQVQRGQGGPGVEPHLHGQQG